MINDSAESTFLQSVIEYPYDDVPRQVYADWLEERGDPRCEFIRLNCQLFRSTREGNAGTRILDHFVECRRHRRFIRVSSMDLEPESVAHYDDSTKPRMLMLKQLRYLVRNDLHTQPCNGHFPPQESADTQFLVGQQGFL